jgi:hypothetical protein
MHVGMDAGAVVLGVGVVELGARAMVHKVIKSNIKY